MSNNVFHKLHYSSLPFRDDKQLHATYSKKMYDDMFKLMMASKEKDINLIFNRSYLGETVYYPLY